MSENDHAKASSSKFELPKQKRGAPPRAGGKETAISGESATVLLQAMCGTSDIEAFYRALMLKVKKGNPHALKIFADIMGLKHRAGETRKAEGRNSEEIKQRIEKFERALKGELTEKDLKQRAGGAWQREKERKAEAEAKKRGGEP